MKYVIVGIEGLENYFLGTLRNNDTTLRIYDLYNTLVCLFVFRKKDFYEDYDTFFRKGVQYKITCLYAIQDNMKELLTRYYDDYSQSYIDVYTNVTHRLLVKENEKQSNPQDINDQFKLHRKQHNTTKTIRVLY